MRYQAILAVLAMSFATVVLAAACIGEDPPPLPQEEGGGSEDVGQAQQALKDCQQCGEGWYCDSGDIVYLTKGWFWTCSESKRQHCPNHCCSEGCGRNDHCC